MKLKGDLAAKREQLQEILIDIKDMKTS